MCLIKIRSLKYTFLFSLIGQNKSGDIFTNTLIFGDVNLPIHQRFHNIRNWPYTHYPSQYWNVPQIRYKAQMSLRNTMISSYRSGQNDTSRKRSFCISPGKKYVNTYISHPVHCRTYGTVGRSLSPLSADEISSIPNPASAKL